jgi:bifunctional non-homologous end joining protein LigD
MASLDTYRAKRDPKKTPEPVPVAKRAAQARRSGPPRFVIQEHHARSLHWDFRLEREGVLVSWAVPKGLPPDRGTNHLAVHVEDHPIEYSTFEGDIPAGEYGAGKVTIWDSGVYDCDKWTENEVKVTLHGKRVDGHYGLFRTKDKQWMIHRIDPAPASWQAMPDHLAPMLATAGDLPLRDDGWGYEFKWDGMRAVVYVDGGRLRILSRGDQDLTENFPELRPLGEALGSYQSILDGEIVVFDESGRPNFEILQPRMHPGASRRRRGSEPERASFLIFDLLHFDGHSSLELPYRDRRALLESLELNGSQYATPAYFVDSGQAVMTAAMEAGLEGVVAKRLDSPYQPGRRTDQWRKIKVTRAQEVVIGGWTKGKGSRGTIGSLLLGIPGPDGLEFVGRVGTGFSQQVLTDLESRLSSSVRKTSPFTIALTRIEAPDPTWVTPKLVGEVAYREWTSAGRLRHPTWRGLRPDKKPDEVVREP